LRFIEKGKMFHKISDNWLLSFCSFSKVAS